MKGLLFWHGNLMLDTYVLAANVFKKKTLDCAMWVWKFLCSFLCIARWCPVVCLPKASSKSAAMRTCICMRSFLHLSCASRMADLVAIGIFFSFYPFHWWKQFRVRECVRAQLRQGLNVSICQPQDFLASELSVISPLLFSLLCATFCFAR